MVGFCYLKFKLVIIIIIIIIIITLVINNAAIMYFAWNYINGTLFCSYIVL